jgi:hypothetical protein
MRPTSVSGARFESLVPLFKVLKIARINDQQFSDYSVLFLPLMIRKNILGDILKYEFKNCNFYFVFY